jgi:hypothetical protein
VPIVLKSGSLNLLEPSGLVQVCNGIALPLLQILQSANIVATLFTVKFIVIMYGVDGFVRGYWKL